MENFDKIFDIFVQKFNIEKGKLLGKGGFGILKEIKNKNKNKIYAAKLIKKKVKISNPGSDEAKDKLKINDNDNSDIIMRLKNPNIVKIYQICEEKYLIDNTEEIFNLIIMEKAVLKDLRTFIKSLFNSNIDNLIYIPFTDIIGDNLLRFFCLQIINGLEFFDRNELIHFDIKPENILIFLELTLKLSDFGLLKDASQLARIRIPGGTYGYLSPEYFQNHGKKILVNLAKKQDYFSLGATIFYLKYGNQMIKHKIHKSNKSEENKVNQDYITDSIQKRIIFIKSDKSSDRDFVDFLCSLIQIDPNDRPTFEEIFRNKWLNKNLDIIKDVMQAFGNDESKLSVEFRKSDYLSEKKKDLQKNNKMAKKFIFIPKK